jgi:hypothetical protein
MILKKKYFSINFKGFNTLKAIPGKEMYGSGVGRHFFPKAHHLYNAKKKLWDSIQILCILYIYYTS